MPISITYYIFRSHYLPSVIIKHAIKPGDCGEDLDLEEIHLNEIKVQNVHISPVYL